MILEGLPRTRLGAVGYALALALLSASGAAEPARGAAEPKGGPVLERAPGTSGTEATALTDRISWPTIVAAVDRHPRVAAAAHERVAARASVSAAGAAPNPSLEVTTAHGRARQGTASRVEWGAELTIPIGWLAQRRSRVAAARAHSNAVDASGEALRRELLVALHALFWNLVHVQERTVALAELSAQTRTLATTVRRRVDAGESRPVEAERVAVEEERVAAELAAVELEEVACRTQLALWLRLPPGRLPVAVADLAQLPRPPSAATARARVRQRHPAVAAASAHVLALQADAFVERRTRVPDLAVGVFADSELDRSAYGVAVSVDLPIWNFNGGNVRRAESELAAGRELLEAQRLDVESAAVELQASCAASVTLASRYRDRMLPRAAGAVRSIERAYELGEASLLEALDARRTYLDTSTELLAAVVRAQNDCSRLAVLLGEPLP